MTVNKITLRTNDGTPIHLEGDDLKTEDVLAALSADSPDLNQIVMRLAHARIDRDEIANQIAAARAEFEASIAEIVAKKKDADLKVTALEDAARAEAITAYTADPEAGKKPHPALGIRISTKPIYEETQALAWAIGHNIRSAIKLDKSGFEKLVKAGGVDTVEVGLTLEETVTATIASDLSEYTAPF